MTVAPLRRASPFGILDHPELGASCLSRGSGSGHSTLVGFLVVRGCVGSHHSCPLVANLLEAEHPSVEAVPPAMASGGFSHISQDKEEP